MFKNNDRINITEELTNLHMQDMILLEEIHRTKGNDITRILAKIKFEVIQFTYNYSLHN